MVSPTTNIERGHTVYMARAPGPHPDKDLNEIILLTHVKTGGMHFAIQHTVEVPGGFLRRSRTINETSLYKHVRGHEYTLIQCVNSIREAKAYLFGVLAK